jgi:hypothetical protein
MLCLHCQHGSTVVVCVHTLQVVHVIKFSLPVGSTTLFIYYIMGTLIYYV